MLRNALHFVILVSIKHKGLKDLYESGTVRGVNPMHSPPHPGELIKDVYMKESQVSLRRLADFLGVTPSTLQRLLSGQNRVSPEMAIRLSFVLGRSAESWMAMQSAYDLWKAREGVTLSDLTPLNRKIAS